MTTATARQRNGTSVLIIDSPKAGMSIFTVFGWVNGDPDRPCHWTAQGSYRMDGQPDPRDLVYHDGLTAHADRHELAMAKFAAPNRFLESLKARGAIQRRA